jgi:hypothetical protein
MDADETARTLRLLDEHRSRGEYVLLSARMVGDEDDHAVWSQTCQAWTVATVAALRSRPNLDGVDLIDAPRVPDAAPSWKHQYEAELRSVTEGLDTLTTVTEQVRATPTAQNTDAARATHGAVLAWSRAVAVPIPGDSRASWRRRPS